MKQEECERFAQVLDVGYLCLNRTSDLLCVIQGGVERLRMIDACHRSEALVKRAFLLLQAFSITPVLVGSPMKDFLLRYRDLFK